MNRKKKGKQKNKKTNLNKSETRLSNVMNENMEASDKGPFLLNCQERATETSSEQMQDICKYSIKKEDVPICK